MPPPQSDPLKYLCKCEKCRTRSPGGKVIPRRTWYRHNPGGKKAGYGSLTAEETQAIERINAIPNVPCPRSKAQKRRHLEIEEVEVTPHPSKRAAGSGSVSAPTLHICASKVRYSLNNISRVFSFVRRLFLSMKHPQKWAQFFLHPSLSSRTSLL